MSASYSATRAFSSHLAASLATEALPHGVDVLAMHPHDGDPPEFVLRRTLRHIGCGQVLADLGILSVLMRLATKLVDSNVLTLAVLPMARRLSSVTAAWDWLRTRSQRSGAAGGTLPRGRGGPCRRLREGLCPTAGRSTTF